MVSDFLIRLARGEREGTTSPSPAVDGDAEGRALRERLAVVQADLETLPVADLLTFGARNASTWALDALCYRASNGVLDWSALRAELLRSGGAEEEADPALQDVTADQLWHIRRVLVSRQMDPEAEYALLVAIAERVLGGGPISKSRIIDLTVALVGAGLEQAARSMLSMVEPDSYLACAVAAELEHPRFGGSLDALLAKLNPAYESAGLTPIDLGGDGETPFTRLRAEPRATVDDGPLVTVIMTCWSPGAELFLAVRSIIEQSYQNWELIVTDDASPEGHDEVLEQVAALDARIRVVRNKVNAGTYIRRNEAIDMARGEFVTMQDSDDWSHPQRLEIQVKDLLGAPQRLANLTQAVRVTDELSLYTPRGMRPRLCEASILFRRDPVRELVGHYDSTRKAADSEFRLRLEAATGRPVPIIGPDVPLELLLADNGSLSGSDFRGDWAHPSRIAYRSSLLRFHELIRDAAESPKLPAIQVRRRINAPAAILGRVEGPSELDMLVVLDGRPSPSRKRFLAAVTQELQQAVQSGLVVGVMHTDSPAGGTAHGYFGMAMQRLVDDGKLHRFAGEREVRASVVVVRHAVAAQGHPGARTQISAERVVVVEDPAGGDDRGRTFAREDVDFAVRGWFGVEPEWIAADDRPLPPLIESIAVDARELQLTVSLDSPSDRVALAMRGDGVDIAVALTPLPAEEAAPQGASPGQLMRGRVRIADVGTGPFHFLARTGIMPGDGRGEPEEFPLEIGPSAILTNEKGRLLVGTSEGVLRLLPDAPHGGWRGKTEFSGRYLQATIRRAAIRGSKRYAKLVLDIALGDHVVLTEVLLIRESHGLLRRPALVLNDAADGQLQATRAVEHLADTRWRIYGLFQTPEGRTQYPLAIDASFEVEDSAAWQMRRLGDVIQLSARRVVHARPSAAASGPTAASPPGLLSTLRGRMPVSRRTRDYILSQRDDARRELAEIRRERDALRLQLQSSRSTRDMAVEALHGVRADLERARSDRDALRAERDALKHRREDAVLRELKRVQTRQGATDEHVRFLHHELLTDIQALQVLLQRYSPAVSLPPVAGWALSPSGLLLLTDLIESSGAETVVECGSGTSTLWVAYALRRLGRGRVVAFDHLPEYAEKTQAYIDAHGLGDFAAVHYAPLAERSTPRGERLWYDIAAADIPASIDVLLVDGPPKATGPHARYPAVPAFAEHFAAGARIIADDTHRPDEKETVGFWLEEERRLRRLSAPFAGMEILQFDPRPE